MSAVNRNFAGNKVNINAASVVYAAAVADENIVNEYPHVIITREVE